MESGSRKSTRVPSRTARQPLGTAMEKPVGSLYSRNPGGGGAAGSGLDVVLGWAAPLVAARSVGGAGAGFEAAGGAVPAAVPFSSRTFGSSTAARPASTMVTSASSERMRVRVGSRPVSSSSASGPG